MIKIEEDILKCKSGGNLTSYLFGLIFFLVGIGLIISYIISDEEFPVIIAGAIFGIIGFLVLTYRQNLIINKNSGIISQTLSFLIKVDKKEYQLKDALKVEVERELRKSKNSSYYVYPVLIMGSSFKITIDTLTKINDARVLSEQVAEFIERNIIDNSSDSMIERDYRTVNTPLKEILKSNPPELNTTPPEELQAEYFSEDDSIIIEIPPTSLGNTKLPILLIIAIGLSPTLIFSLFFFKLITNNINTDITVSAFGIGFALFQLIFVFVMTWVLWKKVAHPLLKKITITLDKEKLKVTEVSLNGIFKIGKVIPLHQLEELTLVEPRNIVNEELLPKIAKTIFSLMNKSSCIIAKSDYEEIVFGGALPYPELKYIINIFKAKLIES